MAAYDDDDDEELLEEALVKFPKEKNATDESQLVERAGHKVKIVPSTYENIKITTPEDLAIAGAFMDRKLGAVPGRARTEKICVTIMQRSADLQPAYAEALPGDDDDVQARWIEATVKPVIMGKEMIHWAITIAAGEYIR